MFFAVFLFHRFFHDQLRRKAGLIEGEQYPKILSSIKGEKEIPMRINFDYKLLDDYESDTAFVCHNENDKIYDFSEKSTHVCEKDDILDGFKIEVLKTILDNAKNYINDLLTVYPGDLNETITAEYTFNPKYNSSCADCDLNVIIVPRFINEETYAASLVTNKDEYSRPIGGFIIIDPKYIPAYSQGIKDENRQYFMILIHEFVHLLGFKADQFSLWEQDDFEAQLLPQYANKPDLEYGKELFLFNPTIREELQRRFGTNKFSNGKKLGLQIAHPYYENDDRESHMNPRLFLDDLMIPYNFNNTRMSNLTLCALYDTGYYPTVKFSRAEEVAYGNGRSQSTEVFQNFFEISPKHYPKDHICQGNNLKVCYNDVKYRGKCEGIQEVDCSSNTTNQDFCENYLPLFQDNDETKFLISSYEYDYAPLVIPTTSCSDPFIANEYNGPDSYCAMNTLKAGSEPKNHSEGNCFKMACDEDLLIVYINNDIKVACSQEGEVLTVSGYAGSFTCPNPYKVCKWTGNTERDRENNLEVILIIVGTFLGVGLCGGIAAIFVIRKKKKEAIEYNRFDEFTNPSS